jgi:hypothetical protein
MGGRRIRRLGRGALIRDVGLGRCDGCAGAGDVVAAMTETRDIIATLRAVLPELRQQWPIGKLALFG